MIVVLLSLKVDDLVMFLYYERVNSVFKLEHYELLQYLSLALASASPDGVERLLKIAINFVDVAEMKYMSRDTYFIM